MQSEIINFFEQDFNCIGFNGSSGSCIEPPPFELVADDFIQFAQLDLEGDLTTHKIINATSNLKRAVDCSLDYFMISMNLDKFFRKKRLGIDRKLGFLSKAGLFNAKSISNLNSFRNRLEHHYEIPNIQELEVYYDLIVAFTIVIKHIVIVSTSESLLELSYNGSGTNNFQSEINFSQPAMKLILPIGKDKKGKVFQANLNHQAPNIKDDLLNFTFLFKLHHLLHELDNNLINKERFLRKLKEDI